MNDRKQSAPEQLLAFLELFWLTSLTVCEEGATIVAGIHQWRQVLGGAIWLWELCNACSRYSPEQWWPVAGGQALPDEQLAENLEVSAATARRWRTRLEKNGLLRSFPESGLKRRLEIRNINFVESLPASAPDIASVN